MIAQRYVHDILQPRVATHATAPMSSFSTKHALSHTVKVSQDCLHTVTTLPWPALSPDLSPIQHIWDHLRR
ncbi:transposable element Tcb2 transposase [Trichonephila clavipes]|nr:transposable element Tcb2 transposase [Trichonephila clavipes]